MKLIVVGSVAYDSIKTIADSVTEVLGGSASYFSLAANVFTKVGVVAVIGKDFKQQDRDLLASKGIDLTGLETAPGKTFRWIGEYTPDFNQAITHDTQLNVFEQFEPILPSSYQQAEYVFLANIDPDLQLKVLTQVPEPRLTACDTMNFWIHGKPASLREVIAKVSILFINDAEVRVLTGYNNFLRAARETLTWGPSAVVLKMGAYGSALITRDDVFQLPAYPLTSVIDTTGAGDSFAGGFMGVLAHLNRTDLSALKQALAVGTCIASYNVQSFSVHGLKDLTLEQVRTRYDRLSKICEMSGLEV